jgi:uncharacterized membrane protein
MPCLGIFPMNAEEVASVPEIFPWMRFLHVMAAIVAFGPTFAFAIIGSMGSRERQHANFASRVTKRIGEVLVEPFALSMLVTGALLIWSGEYPLFQQDTRWLLASIVLYLLAIALSLFVSQPNVRRIVAWGSETAAGDGSSAGGPPPPEVLRSIGVVQRTGMVLTVITVTIVFLMVMKPSFGF